MRFEEASAVHRTLRRIVKALEELGVPYAVAGGMALFLHGFRRFTEDVDILVTKDGLRLLHERLEGLGYVALFRGARTCETRTTGVIEFLTAGDYPGDGKPKPVAFPDPAAVGVQKDGIRCVSLPALVELKSRPGLQPAAAQGYCRCSGVDSSSQAAGRLCRSAGSVRAGQVHGTVDAASAEPGNAQ